MRSSRILASRELAVIRAAKAHVKASVNYRADNYISGSKLAAADKRLQRTVNMLIEYERKHRP